VPTLPVTVDAPVTENAPAAVNNAKLEVVPKVGAVCPKITFGIENKITAVNIRRNVLFILLKFNCD
jgi:hypothetical protein